MGLLLKLPATVVLATPYGRVTLAATDEQPAQGLTLRPRHVQLLADIGRVFPGARVTSLRQIESREQPSEAVTK